MIAAAAARRGARTFVARSRRDTNVQRTNVRPAICFIGKLVSKDHFRVRKLATSAKNSGGRATGRVAFLGSCVSLTFGLGSWQVYRYFWKLDMIEDRSSVLQNTPLSPDEITDLVRDGSKEAIEARTFSRASLCGMLERNKTVFVGPRAPPKHSDAFNDRKVSAEKSGYYLFTPLRLDENGSKILLCEGWLPTSRVNGLENEDTAAWKRPRNVRVTGVLREGGKKPPYSALEADTKRRRFFWIDLEGMASLTNMGNAPVARACFVSALDVEAQGGDENGDIVPVRKPLEAHMDFYVSAWHHVGYAATWFTLSAATLLMTVARLRR